MQPVAEIETVAAPLVGMSPAVRGSTSGQVGPAAWSTCVQWLRWGGAVLLVGAVVAFVAISWRWPVVNDAALIHYVVLLQQHGLTPYVGVHDINFPGAYLPDWVALRYTGEGHWFSADLSWRLYDLALSAAAIAAMMVISKRVDWFAGVFAGALLVLYHGRDGIGQVGQRDYAIAVLLLISCAALLGAFRQRTEGHFPARLPFTRSAAALFATAGMALGAATTIKPFGAAFLLLFCSWTAFELKAKRAPTAAAVLFLLGGFSIPVAAALAFLVEHHALAGFIDTCRVMLPFHALISSPPSRGLLNATQPSLFKLTIPAFLIAVVRKSWRDRLVRLLFVCFLMGAICFWAQQKGYPYQRYPYTPFLLLWMAIEFAAALRQKGIALRVLGTAGILYGVFSCAPGCLRVAAHARWDELYLAPMRQDLLTVAGPAGLASLDGRVQCIDTVSGCIDFLYRMHLTQATGTLYDEFLFPPLASSGTVPLAVKQAQRLFLDECKRHPPRVVIVSPWLFTEGPGNYGKLKRWPAFDHLLQGYSIVDERSFPRTENGPLGYRMYVKKP